MKKALISPIEERFDNDNNPGYRVAFVCDEEFDVAQPLFWIECADNVEQDKWVYVDGNLVELLHLKESPNQSDVIQEVVVEI